MARLIASASFDGWPDISCPLLAPHSGGTILGDSRESGEVGGGASPGTPLHLSWPALCRPSRFHGHSFAILSGLTGTSPVMTSSEPHPVPRRGSAKSLTLPFRHGSGRTRRLAETFSHWR